MGKILGYFLVKVYFLFSLLSARLRMLFVLLPMVVFVASCEHGHFKRSMADKARDREYSECIWCSLDVSKYEYERDKIRLEIQKERMDKRLKELDSVIAAKKAKKNK